MKMVFFSLDASEIELLAQELSHAGIPCEIHRSPSAESAGLRTRCTELWIENDEDFHRTLMLCVRLGVGFARRTAKLPAIEFDWDI